MPAEFIGMENIRRKLQSLLDAKDDALRAAGLSVLLASSKSIVNEGYGGWAPFKRNPKPMRQLLWKTGTMLRSLTLGNADNIMRTDENSITVGSSVAYTAAQNLGSPSHNLPARPFLFLDDERLENATAAIINVLKQKWNK